MRLPSQRYEQIKRKAVALLAKVGEESIPINPFAIAAKIGIRTVSYNSLGNARKAACLKISKSGYKLLLEEHDGTSTWYIFYNDEMPWGHIRFTILHEIGHIVLEHLQGSDVAEAEANFFAKYTIAPPMLVNIIKPTSYMDIADAFELSNEGALNSWNYYQRWLRIPGFTDYELELESLFTVIKKRRRQPHENDDRPTHEKGRLAASPAKRPRKAIASP
ncbi:MAG: ImmA/IrrE family metallo-endopeptidase [Slackia sp.]|nr:ImmA/IrrE family metallo-endopeptidase [Slackia sp.]